MQTAIQQNNFTSGNVIQANAQETNVQEKSHKGHTINYFMWVYVAIFSAIMVIVMVEEKFFIK